MTHDHDNARTGARPGTRGRGGSGGRGRERGRRGPGGRSKANRGDIRAAVLTLLTEEPMHGYQIMQELIERTNGAWRPSPGSVYPSLQQLADERLVSGNDQDGRKIFELTDEGRTVADEVAQGAPPWERLAATAGSVDLRHTMSSVGAAAKQVATTGTADQVAKAEEVLTDARKRLYQLLAE